MYYVNYPIKDMSKDLLEINPSAALADEALAELPKSTLATALVFAIAQSITLNDPNDDENMNLVLEVASSEAVNLAEGIDVIFNSNPNITRH